ncbi:MAG: tyrosine recombinase XerC [Gammaproteobacteria bacterium]|jgi:integrase/recombinase XerC|nr:tyrosine recombinase XerC [Gammaproteobacteria bacterium]MBT7603620.1 tyrosine recombinase XerC [Gammaproteobacteria bacterium]
MSNNKLKNLLDKYIFQLEKVLNYSNNTIISYKRDLNSFIIYCNKVHIEDISLIDEKIIRDFISSLHRNGISPKSIKRSLSSLRGFFNFMVKNKIIRTNFAENIRSPKADKHLPEILQHEDINLLADIKTKKDGYYKNKDLLIRDIAIFELFYSSGLRLSELAGLKLSSINFNESMLRVVGKGNKTRIVPVGSKAVEAIHAWIKIRKSYLLNNSEDFLFIGLRGKFLSVRNIQLRMSLLAKASGVEQKLYPHKLRHTVATHLLESSGNIRAVQEFLGHENISTTQIYTHLDNQYLMTVYDKVHPRSKKILDKD